MKSAYIMKELPEDERPREKLVLNGADSLSNPELLAILLRTGMKGMSAIELSRTILCKITMQSLLLLSMSLELTIAPRPNI